MNHTLLHRINEIEVQMTCRSDDCDQGRKPCPTPAICGSKVVVENCTFEGPKYVIDLSSVATQPMAEGNWADPQRTSFDAAGFGEPSPDLPWGWIPDPKPRNWRAIGMYCAVLAAVIFALAVICPTVPIR